MPLRRKHDRPLLNQADLDHQMVRMVSFIEHEANEMVEEIDYKSEGEFCHIKGLLIQEARQEMLKTFEKKERRVLKQALIENAIMRNDARLRILACKEAHIAAIEAAVDTRLVKGLADKGFYKEVMLNLVLQGLFKMLERVVVVRVREEDKKVVEGLLEPASIRYKKAVGSEIRLYLDNSVFIPPSSLGGVILYTPDLRITVTNTLHRRVEDITHQLIPIIRKDLFKEYDSQVVKDYDSQVVVQTQSTSSGNAR